MISYVPNSSKKGEMLGELGLKSISELFADVPEKIRFERELNLPKGKSEIEVKREMETVLKKNKVMLSFLGGGVWNHFIPAAVQACAGRSEFYTSYTPYQPEISQGILQAFFEYQSMVCEITGMEVANASLYDWATALGEAAIMTHRLTGKKEFLVPKIIHPERKSALLNYIKGLGMKVREVWYDREKGVLDLEDLKSAISNDTAGVYIENPSYLGFFETRAKEIGEITKEKGAKFVVGVDPISLGVAEAPGKYGADIVVGEGQPLGNAMNFGGPLLGIFATRGDSQSIRAMPGRIIGLTKDKEGKRAFCMTFQTREQHIRREKATSNICSNEALCTVSAAVYLATVGGSGLKRIGELCLANSSYAMRRIKEKGYEAPIFKSQHFKEFTVRGRLPAKEIHDRLLEKNIHGGKIIKEEFPELGETSLYCTTELHSKEDIDRLVSALGNMTA